MRPGFDKTVLSSQFYRTAPGLRSFETASQRKGTINLEPGMGACTVLSSQFYRVAAGLRSFETASQREGSINLEPSMGACVYSFGAHFEHFGDQWSETQKHLKKNIAFNFL